MNPMHEPAGPAAPPDDPFAERLRQLSSDLSPGVRGACHFNAGNQAIALGASAADMAEGVGTSDGTVVCAVQAMGFEGMSDLKRALAHALAANPVNPA